jgi:N-methylhydantoinase A
LVDIRHDLATTYLTLAGDADPAAVEHEFAVLEKEAVERLNAESVPPENMILQRSIDMRYQGQWRSLGIPITGEVTSVDDTVAAFHDAHEQEYNYRREEAPVEIYRLNLTAVGTTPKAELAKHPTNGNAVPAPLTTRPVWFDENDDAVETPIYAREDLHAGIAIDGPAIIEQVDATTVVPPGVKAEIDPWLNIRMRISGDRP